MQKDATGQKDEKYVVEFAILMNDLLVASWSKIQIISVMSLVIVICITISVITIIFHNII